MPYPNYQRSFPDIGIWEQLPLTTQKMVWLVNELQYNIYGILPGQQVVRQVDDGAILQVQQENQRLVAESAQKQQQIDNLTTYNQQQQQMLSHLQSQLQLKISHMQTIIDNITAERDEAIADAQAARSTMKEQLEMVDFNDFAPPTIPEGTQIPMGAYK